MKMLNKLIIASICLSVITPVIVPCVTEAATENVITEKEEKHTLFQESEETLEITNSDDIEDVLKTESENRIKSLENESPEPDKEQNKKKEADDKDTNESIPDPSKYTEIKIEGKKMYVSVKGNEWINENGYWHFIKDGQLVKGWYRMSKSDGEKTSHWSYFDSKNGRIYTGWHRMGKAEGEKTPHWSYFGAVGWIRTGWQQMGRGTGNSFGENQAKHWSYFGGNGWLQTGWKCFTKSDGEKSPHWSYFGGNGWLRTGWQQMGKGTGNSYGENSTKHWSYFGGNGWLRTGMQSMGTSANPDGKNKQHSSFFGGNGWLVENKAFTYSNVQYIANSKGWLTQVKSEYDKTLWRAHQLLAKVTNDSMTKDQKLRTSFNHIRDSYPEVRPRTPHYSGAGWHLLYANDIFVNKKGNCFSCCAAFAFMAKAIGYDNVYAISVNGHGWTEINGLVYDAERERFHKGSYFALSYNTPIGTQDALEQYQWIKTAKSPYAKVKI